MSETRKWCYSSADVPMCEHWAILKSRSVTIPGDERSRTAPGHGYPESTTRFVDYIAYTDREEFERDLEKELREFSPAAIGIHVNGAYRLKTSVELVPPEERAK